MKKEVQTEKQITCSVVGARGYVGLETIRLLLQHPMAKITHCFATSDFDLSHYISHAEAKKVQCLKDSEIFENLTDVVFLATPAEVSMELAPKIVAANKKVIDLSGAFRLKKNSYQQWYGFEHTEKESLQQAEYGLVPWIGPAQGNAQKSGLIANPGCFASAINLALIPLLKAGVMQSENIVIDAKSGTTGAGKKATENLLFTEVEGECLPYKVGEHQHYPEIQEAVEKYSGKKIDAHMSTSLLPIRRGIIAGIYGKLCAGKTLADVSAAYREAYQDYALVKHASFEKTSPLLSLKKVVGTAETHITYKVVGEKLYVYSSIDNLLKGAASQAIENFNRISDLPKTMGVSHLEAVT